MCKDRLGCRKPACTTGLSLRREAEAPSTSTDTTLRHKLRSLPGSLPEIPEIDRDHVNDIYQTEVFLPDQFPLLVSALGGCEIAMVRSAPLPSDGGERNQETRGAG